ncbi:hypothetical protein TSUD_35350 [Trifolium subterraneum]|uniref:Uncharacterized protein n=1 Tax=Trifolium subterraneum TaxID=3900 RepID=A0A2Z6M822_TRISU|nr:hypothetical protein TSUD_35350 [Trifolium subterraneum]
MMKNMRKISKRKRKNFLPVRRSSRYVNALWRKRESINILPIQVEGAGVNDEIFHIRVIEDSYGPMRIMVPQTHHREGRDDEGGSTEDEEEELFPAAEEVMEREDGHEKENLLALIPINNANNVCDSVTGNVSQGRFFREELEENSNQIIIDDNLNLNNEVVGEFMGGDLEERNSIALKANNLKDHVDLSDGPANSSNAYCVSQGGCG